MKYIKTISWFLGISMFMFGFLKFFDPFKGWYSVQISGSGLGEVSYAMGILGELSVGLSLMGALLLREKLPPRVFYLLIAGASLLVVVIMVTGVYVHLQPSVLAEVLPMNIKPPYIPGFFMLLGLLNAWLLGREFRRVLFPGILP